MITEERDAARLTL